MDAAAPSPNPGVPKREPLLLSTAWPPGVQWATAFLLGMAMTLLAVQGYRSSRWAAQPTELTRGEEPGYRIDLNHADLAELGQLPGVGDQLTRRIEEHRQHKGPFRNVDDLKQVRGIGPATLERVRGWVRVDDAERGDAAPPSTGKGADRRAPAGVKEASLTAPVDVNQATAEELQRLPGIGPVMAQRIVEERGRGPFKSVDELRRVKGIGPKTLQRLRPFVQVESTPAGTITAKAEKTSSN